MKGILLIVAIALLLALAPLPIGYYTFLRILVTISSILIIAKELKIGLTIWSIFFGITAIIFNPIIPICLYQKSLWIPIDIVAVLIFLSYSFKKR